MRNLPGDFMHLLSELRERDFKIGGVQRPRYPLEDYITWVEEQPVSAEAQERFRNAFKGDEYLEATLYDVEMTVETLLHRAHIEVGNE